MPSGKGRFSIGALSGRSGVNVETIRYYERTGLLPNPPRTEGGHRLYGVEQLKRLAFIRRSRELGFSIEEIRALLDLVDSGDYACGQVKSMTDRHLESVRSKMADLRKLEKTLANVSAQCAGGAVPECPIIDTLCDE
ncbi:MAG: helix-turn-helix domain-containing protein [Gammaproteobacteria bacterium]|nr:helix-turn-helix domain-containing protein [Gammaproteobacteria bacterium]NIR84467.1 helix-turn-helix domain-containing protein [Gammaproteobacteria bacterium]NIR90102.1 helix-turn-helix domain-containing protein [Gammaproteobacteria bacterium]NIU05505.1 helix-turn-helix domain-containing protein [Gammaproteobacteria bacterium]NIV52651.1 MerR family DNA-binding protein [Gammaproteobacteria bacterium]